MVSIALVRTAAEVVSEACLAMISFVVSVGDENC